MAPTPEPRAKNGMVGKPGTMAIAPSTPAAISRGSGRPNICLVKSTPRLLSPAARVVITPPDTEISNDGMIVTRPSPTVRTV